MVDVSHIFRRVGGLFPKSLLSWIEKKLKVAGIGEDAVVWTGRRFLLSLMFSFACALFYLEYTGRVLTALAGAVFIVGFLLLYALFYLELFFITHNRTKIVEKVLPDFLLLIVSNLRAGLPPYSAFVHSAREDFGPLYEAIKIATARLGGKASIEDALEEVSTHFDSPMFKRTATFFGKGTKAGGQIAKLIERSADEIRKIQDLRNELVAGTKTYVVFLIFIIVIVMPFLLGISTHFISMFVSIQKSTVLSSQAVSGSLPIFGGGISITAEEMVNISIITLVVTNLFVSLLMGVILAGMAPYGLRYFPILAVASVGAFMMMRTVIQSLLSTFIGG